MKKFLYDENGVRHEVHHINGYLADGLDVWVESRTKPLCDVPEMIYGNKPTDGGNLFLTVEEKNALIKDEPQTTIFIKSILGSEEFINHKERYCLWLVGASPAVLAKCPLVKKRIERVQQMRLASKKAATRKKADIPQLFDEIRQPESGCYIIVPRVSSERRKYIPIGFLDFNTIVSDSALFIPNATLYHFGVLTSSIHNAWMRTVCGRLKSDYRYSANIVYNNFPWPNVTDDQKAEIEKTAQAILDARAKFPDSSLADLYDPLTMPIELRKAHQANDAAVMKAYGFAPSLTEPEIVSRLFEMYAKMVKDGRRNETARNALFV